jgi:hypothetical protein
MPSQCMFAISLLVHTTISVVVIVENACDSDSSCAYPVSLLCAKSNQLSLSQGAKVSPAAVAAAGIFTDEIASIFADANEPKMLKQ